MIVITGGTLIDGTGAAPQMNATVLVDGNRIVGAGSAAAVPVPAAPPTMVLDATGKTIMPGVIDAHDHLASVGYDMASRLGLSRPQSLAHIETVANLRETLAAGITTVRDAAWLDAGFKLAVERGLIPGPRLWLSLNIISPTGGIGDRTTITGVSLPPPGGLPSGVANGVDAVRAKVRELVRCGADVIKTVTTGGVASFPSGPLDAEYSPPELAAIVDEARILGKRVMVHAIGGAGLRMAVEAGVHSIEHGGYLGDDPELLQMMADSGMFFVPTFLVYRHHGSEHAAAPYMPPRAQAMREHHVRSLQLALTVGVRVAMGTDAGGYEHGHNQEELQLMVEAGMTPMQAIVASTKTAAECLEMDAAVGTLTPGKLADLLVVDGNPLADISVLQQRSRLHLIMKDGAPFVNTLAVRGGAEAAAER